MAKYIIDQTHSDISFKVKHMMISSVAGTFNNYEASLTAEEADFNDAVFECVIDVNSLYTGIEDRDANLKSELFFDCSRYPEMKFKTISVNTFSNQHHYEYSIIGDLQIKNDSRNVKLSGTYNGIIIDECGQEKYCFKLKGVVQRLRWFLDFAVTNSRSVLIDNNVELILDLQFLKLEEYK